MKKNNQEQLLLLCRRTLENGLLKKNWNLEDLRIPEFDAERGLFVTLTKAGNLRGCIGNVQAVASIFDSAVSLVKAAAFDDSRFSPLEVDELKGIKIEISILTEPVELLGGISEDKIAQIRPFIDGVIIEHDFNKATFLPQVWEQLPDKDDFMSHLCLKAGMLKYSWQHELLKISTYQVEKFEEE